MESINIPIIVGVGRTMQIYISIILPLMDVPKPMQCRIHWKLIDVDIMTEFDHFVIDYIYIYIHPLHLLAIGICRLPQGIRGERGGRRVHIVGRFCGILYENAVERGQVNTTVQN